MKLPESCHKCSMNPINPRLTNVGCKGQSLQNTKRSRRSYPIIVLAPEVVKMNEDFNVILVVASRYIHTSGRNNSGNTVDIYVYPTH